MSTGSKGGVLDAHEGGQRSLAFQGRHQVLERIRLLEFFDQLSQSLWGTAIDRVQAGANDEIGEGEAADGLAAGSWDHRDVYEIFGLQDRPHRGQGPGAGDAGIAAAALNDDDGLRDR